MRVSVRVSAAPRVREVRAKVSKPSSIAADYHHQEKGHWIVDSSIANPMSVYSKYKASRTRYLCAFFRSLAVGVTWPLAFEGRRPGNGGVVRVRVRVRVRVHGGCVL